jgi:arabinogalactan endo-1,4-beta-galactosidase
MIESGSIVKTNQRPVLWAAVRRLMAVTLSIGTANLVRAQTTEPSPFLLGADISTLSQVERQGGVFRDDNKPQDALAIFTDRHWNCFRLRLFVHPNGRGGVINSLDYTRALAKRIKATGATFILDIHYSDTWADPQHQDKPVAWKNLPFDAIEQEVQDYTQAVVSDLKAAGALPDIVQVGNEITGGTLWPDAQVAVPLSTVKVFDATVKPIKPPEPYDDVKQWDNLTRIIKAGARGVRLATAPSDHVRIMIHIDCGGDWPLTKWYFDHLQAQKVDYDMIGQSYYPYWHGTLDNVRDNLQQTAERYGRDIVIVETAYPWKSAARWEGRKNMHWPVSAEGQRQFLVDLIQTVKETPGNHGIGVVYWHPESVPTTRPSRAVWNGGDMSLFGQDGNALPAMDAGEVAGILTRLSK